MCKNSIPRATAVAHCRTYCHFEASLIMCPLMLQHARAWIFHGWLAIFANGQLQAWIQLLKRGEPRSVAQKPWVGLLQMRTPNSLVRGALRDVEGLKVTSATERVVNSGIQG